MAQITELKIVEVCHAEDLERVRELFAEYARDLPHDLSFQNFEEELRTLPGRYALPSGRLLLAYVAGPPNAQFCVGDPDQPPSAGDQSPRRAGVPPVGCVALRQIGAGIGEMKRLFVQPEHRGKGIGRALAQAVIEQARQIGYKRIRLDAVLEPALCLYRSLGFREIEPYQHVPIAGVVFMELEMTVHFKKYHGLGNDYLVIDPNVQDFPMTEAAIRLICDRNFGVGSDGILYGPCSPAAWRGHLALACRGHPARDSRAAPVRSAAARRARHEEQGRDALATGGGATQDMPILRIFNPDGSEAEKSGNGLRIFAKYLFEKKYVRTRSFPIQTLGGVVDVQVQDETASLIRINMGRVTFLSDEIPVAGPRREVINEPLDINGVEHRVTCLSIGNPHCVIPMKRVSEETARALGPCVENHKLFPNRINMQIVRVIDRAHIDIRIWERGAGYTLASGSSSCAAAAASHRLGFVDNNVTVHMPGGTLQIEIGDDGRIHMTGPVEGTFEGCFHSDLLKRISKTK